MIYSGEKSWCGADPVTVELRYTLWRYGEERTMEVPEDITSLFIGDCRAEGFKIIAQKGPKVVAEENILIIETLDLSELAGCQTLEELFLERNSRLLGLDLAPLTSCKNLTTLKIVGTGRSRKETEQLDLKPLASCPSLSRLVLSNNGLYEHYDLRPLIHCPNLRVLDLAGNHRLDYADITPLLLCPNLRELNASARYQKDEPRGIALFSKKTMERLMPFPVDENVRHYSIPVRLGTGHFELLMGLLPIAIEHEPDKWKHLHIARALLAELDVQERAFLDVSPDEL